MGLGQAMTQARIQGPLPDPLFINLALIDQSRPSCLALPLVRVSVVRMLTRVGRAPPPFYLSRK